MFVATESGRPLGELPEQLSISVITLAELELGVLRAPDSRTRARRLATLARVRSHVPAVPISASIASTFAAIAAELLERGTRPKIQDTWIAATAVALGVPVCTQDDDFDGIPHVQVIRV